MKRLTALLMAATLGFTIVACSPPQETEEVVDESTETAIPSENEVALSMTYPEAIGDMEFMVAGTWEKIEGEDQLTFNTGFSTIIVGVSDDDDPVALVERMLGNAGIPVGDLLYIGNTEEIEVNGVSGSKEGIRLDGTEGEVFVWNAGSRTYALIALYPDKSRQAASFEAVDTLFSSMRFTEEEGQPESDGEPPLTDQSQGSPAGDGLSSEGFQAPRGEG